MRVGVVVCSVALAACSGGDGGGTEEDDATSERSGCPVEPVRVGELLGYDVEVDEDTAATSSCRFVPVDGDAHPGAHVVVVERDLADDGFAAALAAVESAAGPAEPLPEGSVGGVDGGWVARLGRVAQVGAARDDRLVQVTVADGALEVAAAEEVAIELARDVLG